MHVLSSHLSQGNARMGDAVNVNMHSSLQSKDDGQLLDLLRSQGISHCPNSSSAVTNPRAKALCLRLSPESGTQQRTTCALDSQRSSFFAEVRQRMRLLPSCLESERSDDERKKLLGFKPPTVKLDEFPSLVDAARDSSSSLPNGFADRK